tara:strand:- start:19872 stop:20309 length:438 start_codon:yes stop_codon:yes gene_type:complete
MDLSKVKVKDTTIISGFKYPSGDLIIDEKTKKPVTIEVYGSDSVEFQTMIANRARRDQLRAKATARDANEDREVTVSEVDAAKQASAIDYARCTVAWTGFYEEGKPLECTQENAARLYTSAPYIKRRVDAVIGDQSAFFEKQPVS